MTVSRLVSLALAYAALCLVIAIFVLHLKVSHESGLFTPFSLVEEAAYTFTSAQNYLDFGFLNSGLLQDFASGADPGDHPYVYNHMPPGPDIAVALLMGISGGSTLFARVVLGLGAVAGLGVYFVFARCLLREHGLELAGVAILMLGVWNIANFMERQVLALYPLLALLPLLAFAAFLKSGRAWHFTAACSVAFLSSLYIEYSALTGVVACWVFLYFTQLLPIRLRHLGLVLGAFAAGIVLHLLQNLLYLGPEIFFQELWFTLANRIAGVPSQEELRGFYQSIGVVHHGSHEISWPALVAQLRRDLVPPGLPILLVLMAIVIALGFVESRTDGKSKSDVSPKIVPPPRQVALLFSRFAIWIIGSVCAPIFMFPAFAQEVTPGGFGANLLFIGIGAAAVLTLSVRQFSWCAAKVLNSLKSTSWSDLFRQPLASVSWRRMPLIATTRHVAFGAALFVLIGQFAMATFSTLHAQTLFIRYLSFQERPEWSSLEDIRAFSGELFMTNINVPLVGLLTRAPGFGVCGLRSMGQDGEPLVDNCKVGFMRRLDHWKSKRPRYFFYFSNKRLFPGFADCLPANTVAADNRDDPNCMAELLGSLERHHKLAFENAQIKVFDLGATDRKK